MSGGNKSNSKNKNVQTILMYLTVCTRDPDLLLSVRTNRCIQYPLLKNEDGLEFRNRFILLFTFSVDENCNLSVRLRNVLKPSQSSDNLCLIRIRGESPGKIVAKVRTERKQTKMSKKKKLLIIGKQIANIR